MEKKTCSADWWLCLEKKEEVKASPTRLSTQKFKADKYKRRKQKIKISDRPFGREDMIWIL